MNNSHGFANEIKISQTLDQKTFCNLNDNLKKFILKICSDHKIEINGNTVIHSYCERKNLKQDIYIKIHEKIFGISVKRGKGNSIHQEKCEDFVRYIEKECNATIDLQNEWRFFIWADGTLDGTGDTTKKTKDGKILSRFCGKIYSTLYPERQKKLQNFIDGNQEKLIRHFLFGEQCETQPGNNVHYLYYGDADNGSWASKEELILYLLKKSSNKKRVLDLCGLGIQVWNVSQKGTSEKKRGQIQVKYSQLSEDLEKILQ